MSDVPVDLDALLPIPYLTDGRDPSIGLDCLGLALFVARDVFGIPAEDPWDSFARQWQSGTFQPGKDDAPAWRRVDRPYRQGDLAVFDRGFHVAVFVGSTTLLSTTKGIGVHLVAEKRLTVPIEGVFRWMDPSA